MNTLMENPLAIGILISVLAMFAVMISAIYGDIRRRRAAEEAAELERQEDESVRAEYEAELEARYQAELDPSEQYREWQAGGPAPSGWLSQF